MINFFRKLFSTPSVPSVRTTGYFSTDIETPAKGGSLVEAGVKLSIQKPLPTPLKSPSGEIFAMDDSIQNEKLMNSGAFGTAMPETQFFWYASQGFIGFQTAAILAQNWLIDKACTMPGRDAVRHGYEITVNDGTAIDPKILDEIRRMDKKFKIKKQCTEFVRKGRIFGIRIAMFDIDNKDPLYYEKPFNPDGITPGSYRGITQLDPYWITPELSGNAASNPAAPDFYEPTWWRINGKRVHRTHLIIMRNGDELTDILKPSYIYGGIPVPQKLAERVYAAERTANEAPMLALSKRTTVLHADLSQAVTNLQSFLEKIELWTRLRDNFGVKIAGTEETVEQFDTSLTDLDAVIMTQFQLVAAAAEVPATKLLGTSPKGFNATGEYEEASYHEFLESLQEHDLTPLVDRHHLLLIRSYIAPKFSIAPFATEINWKPVDSPTAKEQADINLTKGQTDNALVQAGAIDGTDVRNRIIADKDSGYNGIPDVVPDGPGDREAQQAAEVALEQPLQASNKQKQGGDK